MGGVCSSCLQGIKKSQKEAILQRGPTQPCSACKGQGVDSSKEICSVCCGTKKEPVMGWAAAEAQMQAEQSKKMKEDQEKWKQQKDAEAEQSRLDVEEGTKQDMEKNKAFLAKQGF